RQFASEIELALRQPFEHQVKGHQFGERGRMSGSIGVTLVEDVATIGIEQQGRVLVVGGGVCRRQAQARQQQANADADALASPWPRPKAKKRQIPSPCARTASYAVPPLAPPLYPLREASSHF